MRFPAPGRPGSTHSTSCCWKYRWSLEVPEPDVLELPHRYKGDGIDACCCPPIQYCPGIQRNGLIGQYGSNHHRGSSDRHRSTDLPVYVSRLLSAGENDPYAYHDVYFAGDLEYPAILGHAGECNVGACDGCGAGACDGGAQQNHESSAVSKIERGWRL